MSGAQPGMISLRVIEAQKLKNVTMMHTMNPYVEIVINGTKLHTTHQGGPSQESDDLYYLSWSRPAQPCVTLV
jgi:hypothetical protein